VKDKLELAFVLAPHQNLFFRELVEAIRCESEELGVETSLHVGNFPKPHSNRVYVITPPHEYFRIMHGHPGPSEDTLKRTVYICCEQPGTGHFNENIWMAPSAGAVFDINHNSYQIFNELGIKAHHLQLGWTRGWDHFNDGERDIDVLFMGCSSEKRNKALAKYGRILNRRNCRLIISDNSRPNWRSSQIYQSDKKKWDLLSRAKVIINIHQSDHPYFEWLRIVQAMSSGVVVVSEHSLCYQPLVAGKHFLSGKPEALGLLAELLLEDHSRLKTLQSNAYQAVKGLGLRNGVKDLVTQATLLLQNKTPDVKEPCFSEPTKEFKNNLKNNPSFTELDEPEVVYDYSDGKIIRQAIKNTNLELLDVRRQLRGLEHALTMHRKHNLVEIVGATNTYAHASPKISILVALYNHSGYVTEALESVRNSSFENWELIVVDDGSSDESKSRFAVRAKCCAGLSSRRVFVHFGC
jgi:hypothetical protein